MKFQALCILTLALVVGGISPVAGSLDAERPLFFTPTSNGQVQVLAAINGAKSSVHMTIFNLSDPAVIDALVAAKTRGVDVKVIMDKSLADRKVNGPFDQLVAAGVDTRKSSPRFSITHNKSFTVDAKVAYVMTLNLTKISNKVRDVALITSHGTYVKFVEDLFAMDWDNAANATANTPPSIPSNFVVAPDDAKVKLLALIDGAKTQLKIAVENLSHTEILNALAQAKARGVDVQVLLPRCNITNADFNMPAAQQLDQAGVTVRMMPGPDTPDSPYIHEKIIVADDARGFLGSENFSFNSIEHARELGILFDDPLQIRQMTDTYDLDFGRSMNYADSARYSCGKSTASEDEIMDAMAAQ